MSLKSWILKTHIFFITFRRSLPRIPICLLKELAVSTSSRENWVSSICITIKRHTSIDTDLLLQILHRHLSFHRIPRHHPFFPLSLPPPSPSSFLPHHSFLTLLQATAGSWLPCPTWRRTLASSTSLCQEIRDSHTCTPASSTSSEWLYSGRIDFYSMF